LGAASQRRCPQDIVFCSFLVALVKEYMVAEFFLSKAVKAEMVDVCLKRPADSLPRGLS
jgi:hypothetical protein